MARVVSRRDILKTAGAVVGGSLVLRPIRVLATSPFRNASILYGLIESIEVGTSASMRGPAHGYQAKVVFGRDARFWRDGFVDLSAFVPGDEVVAEGEWSGSVFLANYLESTYRTIKGVVLKRDGTLFETTDGNFRISPEAMIVHDPGSLEKSIEQLAIGDYVVARGRFDPVIGLVLSTRIQARLPDQI